MKNIKNKLTAIILCILMPLSFAGCSNSKTDIQDAIKKSETITSGEAKTTLKLNLNVDNTQNPKTNPLGLNFKNLEFSFDSKIQQDKNEYSKTENDINLKMMNLAINFKIFTDSSIDSKHVNHGKFYIEVPSILKSMLGSDYTNIKYMYLDIDKLNKKQGLTDADTAKSVEAATNLRKSFGKFLSKYIEATDKKLITKKDATTAVILNGKNQDATTYELNISDTQFKSFLKSYINSNDTDKDLIAFLKTLAKNSGEQSSKYDYKKFKDNFNKNFSKLPRIFGNKGLNIQFSIADGYIIKTKVNVNFAKTDKKTKKVSDGGNILMTVDYSKINDKNTKVTMPKIDKTNSLDLSEQNMQNLK